MAETEKWTDIEHLPQWDEEFYLVYTAKKHGKWVMLKTLRPEYRDDPFGRELIDKEFDVRYNLSHPSIVMINDYEDVPGLGRSIITDDVYGDSLATLIEHNAVTPQHIEKLQHELVDALAYIQRNHLVHHPLRAESVIFTKDVGNLKLIDVGFDQHESLSPATAREDITNYGKLLDRALDACHESYPRLRRIAARCQDDKLHYGDISSLRVALGGRDSRNIYIAIMGFLAAMLILLILLTIFAN